MTFRPSAAAADVMAAVSTSAAGFSWFAPVNDIMQLTATAVAIAAGVYAIKWHRLRIKNEERTNGKSD